MVLWEFWALSWRSADSIAKPAEHQNGRLVKPAKTSTPPQAVFILSSRIVFDWKSKTSGNSVDSCIYGEVTHMTLSHKDNDCHTDRRVFYCECDPELCFWFDYSLKSIKGLCKIMSYMRVSEY